ncbi:MAG: ester cyclase [Chloroflexales bacterium]
MSGLAADLGRRFFEDVLGPGDWAVGAEIIAANVVMHHPSSPAPIASYEAVKGFLSAFRAGFPDLHMTVEDAFGDDEKGAVRWRMQGTHTADLFGIPPSGKAVSVQGISVVRIANGQIAEDWVAEDTMGLMQQLGVIPAAG